MSYDELVKRLREHNGWALNETLDEAADAIEELQRKVEDYETRLDLPPEAQYAIDKHADDLIARMDGMIKALDDKPKWIPATEFPPEGETYGDTTFSVEVLGTEGFTYRKAYYNFKCEVWIDENEEQEWPSITYWMYLPEPPKEEA